MSPTEDQVVVRNGDTINYDVFVANLNSPPGGCDIVNATTSLTVPGPSGAATGPTTVLASGQNYPIDFPSTKVGPTVPYVVNVNPGVTQVIATARLSGTLQNFPVGGTITHIAISKDIAAVVTSPHTTLVKTASAPSGKAPLSETYTYSETNDGANAPISNVVLTDSNCAPVTFVSGDTNTNGILDVGETFVYTCSNVLTKAGTIVNTATANGTDVVDAKAAPVETATASVLVSPATPSLSTAASSAAPAPGASGPTISDTATLSGGSAPTGSIVFKVFGPNDTNCTNAPLATTAPVTVTSNGTYASGPIAVPAPGTYRFEAIYSGDANNAGVPGSCPTVLPSTEAVSFPAPVIGVTKSASPASLPEPGGTFTFTVTVTNPSAVDPVKITSLVDNIYGDLATRTGSNCGLLIGTTLAPGGTSSPCSFSGPFAGTAGQTQTDTVTATGVDSNGFVPPPAVAQATVTITPKNTPVPMIGVTKAVAPASLPEPGGNFTYTVTVKNPSASDPVKIVSLMDDIYGNLQTRAGSTCGSLIGTTLAPGATSAPCSFTGTFTGKAGASETDTVTATGIDSNGLTPPPATARATVTLTPAAPQIAVTKVAEPLTRPAPGGTFNFTVTVSNPSTLQPVVITTLVDNVYGNLASRAGSTCGTLIGVSLAPGTTSPSCTFTGSFTGKSGDSETDTVTVTGVSNGTTVTATAQATVSLTPAAQVAKPAAVVSPATVLHRPSGCVSAPATKIYVTGAKIKSVSFSVDGKHVATVTKHDSNGRYMISVKTAGLRPGPHPVVAVVHFTNGTSRTFHASVVRCQQPRTPLFTG